MPVISETPDIPPRQVGTEPFRVFAAPNGSFTDDL
jgi:hypothetical protein